MQNKFTNGFLDADPTLKGYLPERTIIQIVLGNFSKFSQD